MGKVQPPLSEKSRQEATWVAAGAINRTEFSPSAFSKASAPRFRPCLVFFSSFAEARRRVRRDGYVEFDAEYYSVPPGALDREVRVRGESHIGRILDHRQKVVALHARAEAGRSNVNEGHIQAHERSRMAVRRPVLAGTMPLLWRRTLPPGQKCS